MNFVDPLRNFTEKVQDQIGKYRRRAPGPHLRQRPFASDFARLARRLCGKSVGLVLGGGGARGIAHIGVLQALAEKGIPVDMVGGTSIGSFIGGLYAQEADIVQTLGRAKRFAGRMATLWRMLTDVTYPIVSYTTGAYMLSKAPVPTGNVVPSSALVVFPVLISTHTRSRIQPGYLQELLFTS